MNGTIFHSTHSSRCWDDPLGKDLHLGAVPRDCQRSDCASRSAGPARAWTRRRPSMVRDAEEGRARPAPLRHPRGGAPGIFAWVDYYNHSPLRSACPMRSAAEYGQLLAALPDRPLPSDVAA